MNGALATTCAREIEAALRKFINLRKSEPRSRGFPEGLLGQSFQGWFKAGGEISKGALASFSPSLQHLTLTLKPLKTGCQYMRDAHPAVRRMV